MKNLIDESIIDCCMSATAKKLINELNRFARKNSVGRMRQEIVLHAPE